MSITCTCFGHLPCGREVQLYRLINKNGASVAITNLGGTHVAACHMLNKEG